MPQNTFDNQSTLVQAMALQAITWGIVGQDPCRHMTSLGYDGSMNEKHFTGLYRYVGWYVGLYLWLYTLFDHMCNY